MPGNKRKPSKAKSKPKSKPKPTQPPTPPKKKPKGPQECTIYPIYKLEIVLSGRRKSFRARVAYTREANEDNTKKIYRRGRRKDIKDALYEWQLAYPHRLQSLQSLDKDQLIEYNEQ